MDNNQVTITRAGGCKRVWRGAVKSFFTLAFSGTGLRGFGVLRTDLAELALYRGLEVTRFTSCVGEKRERAFLKVYIRLSVKQRQEEHITDQDSFESTCQEALLWLTSNNWGFVCRGMKRDFPDELPRPAFSTQRANFRPSCQCQPEGNAALNPSGDLILFLVNTQYKNSLAGRTSAKLKRTNSLPQDAGGQWAWNRKMMAFPPLLLPPADPPPPNTSQKRHYPQLNKRTTQQEEQESWCLLIRTQVLGGSLLPGFSAKRSLWCDPGVGGREKRSRPPSTQDLDALIRHQGRRTFAPRESPQWRRRSRLSMGGWGVELNRWGGGGKGLEHQQKFSPGCHRAGVGGRSRVFLWIRKGGPPTPSWAGPAGLLSRTTETPAYSSIVWRIGQSGAINTLRRSQHGS